MIVALAVFAILFGVACRGREETTTPLPGITPMRTTPGKPAGITPESAPQFIQSFTTDDEIITAGQCTNLRWLITGTTTVTLDGQRVTGDWKEVCPTRTTRYTLEAGGEKEKLAVAVLAPPAAPTKPPKIAEFDADDPQINPGQATVLRWSVADAQLILLNDEPQTQPEPNMRVRPPETTTYRLVAINRLGQDEKEFTVQVGQPAPPPVVKSFDADDPELIPPKSTTTLRWDVTGADRVTLNDRAMKEPNKKVTLLETTTYTLKAYARGSNQPVTKNLTVKVGEPRTNNPPQIASFDADHPTLKSGQPETVGAGCTILRWDVKDASWIKLDGKSVTGTNTQICPRVTKTYTLTAGRATQKANPKTTTVKVGDTRGAGAGDYLQILSARQTKDDKGDQTLEVKVNYGLSVETFRQKKDLRLHVSAMVWNDLEGEEQTLSQFFALPQKVEVGQREITLNIKYQGWKEQVGDHVKVEMIEQQPPSPFPPKPSGSSEPAYVQAMRSGVSKLTDESMPAVFLDASYEHPDMIWKPASRILRVEAHRGLLATELKVAVAYFYNGAYGDNVVLGAEPEGAVGITTGQTAQGFAYTPTKIKSGEPALAVVTIYYNGTVDAKSDRLKVFMRPKDDPKQRFEVKEIPLVHTWSPNDLRITEVKRAPGNTLLVAVAYALNTRPSMPVAFRACDSIRNEDVEGAPVAGKSLLSRLKPACASGDPTHLLAAIRWNGDETPTRSAVEEAIPTNLTGSRFGTVYQGHGTAWFLVYNDWWMESFETDLLEVQYAEGVDAEGVKKGWDTGSRVIRAKPVSLKWQSKLLGKFTLTCSGPDGNAGNLKEMEWKGGTFKETSRTRYFGATLGKDAIGVASLSPSQCNAILTGCNQSKTERLNPKVGKGTPTPVPTPQVCKVEQVLASRPNPVNPRATLPPEVIQLGDIVRVSSPTDPMVGTLNVPITMEYVGAPVLTVHVTYGDLMVRGMPVTIADCQSAKKCPNRPVYTDANGDVIFYDLTLSPAQNVTVKVEVPANYPNKEIYANYETKGVLVGEGEEHEADLTPSYIIGVLDSVTFYRDEDPGVDEWMITTEGRWGSDACSKANACLPNMWPYFEKDLYAQAAWYEAQGGDVVSPHLPIFLFRADKMPRESLTFKVSGIENDYIAAEWFTFVTVITDLVKWAAEAVSAYYTGSTELGKQVGEAIQEGALALMGWFSEPEALGTLQFTTPRPGTPWAETPLGSQHWRQGDVSADFSILRERPVPGRKLNVRLKKLHVGDNSDDAAIRGDGDIILYTRVCNGRTCTTKYYGNEWQVDDNTVFTLPTEYQLIFGPGMDVGAFLYIEVGVWDYDGWAENADMLGTVSILLTEDDDYGVGAPILLSDSGYDGGSVTVELEVTWQ